MLNERPIQILLRGRATRPRTSCASLIAPLVLAQLLALPLPAHSALRSSPSTIGNPYLFQGARYDAETGFYYFRNRTYDPRAGRFLQRDPVWDEQNVGGWQTFAGNNPVSRADPSGLGDGDGNAAGSGWCPLPPSESDQVRKLQEAVNRLRRNMESLHILLAGYRPNLSRIPELKKLIEMAASEIEPQLTSPAVQPLLADWFGAHYLYQYEGPKFGTPEWRKKADIEDWNRYEEERLIQEQLGLTSKAPRKRPVTAADALQVVKDLMGGTECETEGSSVQGESGGRTKDDTPVNELNQSEYSERDKFYFEYSKADPKTLELYQRMGGTPPEGGVLALRDVFWLIFGEGDD